MKSLNKSQRVEMDSIRAGIAAAEYDLKEAIEELGKRLHEDWQCNIEPKIEAVNGAMGRAEEFVEGIHDHLEAYYEERSEKWQDSEEGKAFSEWMDQWCVQCELELPEPEVPCLDDYYLPSEAFEEIPSEAA